MERRRWPVAQMEEKSKTAEVSKRFVKKTIDKIIYPRRYQVRNDSCLEGSGATRGAAFIQSEDGSDPRQDQGEDLRRASTESMRLDPGEPSSTKVPWTNSAGGVCSVTPNLQRLPAKNLAISRVLRSPQDVHCWSGRQRLGGLPQHRLHRGFGPVRSSVFCRSAGAPSRDGEIWIRGRREPPWPFLSSPWSL